MSKDEPVSESLLSKRRGATLSLQRYGRLFAASAVSRVSWAIAT